MTAEIIEDAAFHRARVMLVAIVSIVVIHVGFGKYDVSDPSRRDRLTHEPDGRVGAIHVTDLKGDAFRTTQIDDFAIRPHLLSARLVTVHGYATCGINACDLHQVAIRRLDKNYVEVHHLPCLTLGNHTIARRIERIRMIGR